MRCLAQKSKTQQKDQRKKLVFRHFPSSFGKAKLDFEIQLGEEHPSHSSESLSIFIENNEMKPARGVNFAKLFAAAALLFSGA